MTADNDHHKSKMLEEMLVSCGKVAIAFSGGVDSTFLLGVASSVLPGDVLAITVSAPFISQPEVNEARRTAAGFDVRHMVIEAGMDEIRGFAANPPDRCYICKKFLFSRIKEIAGREGFECVIDASNADDIGDYRPGLKALAELGIKSPLKDAGLTKSEVRAMSRARGYANWSRPAAACLASRIPYGETITSEKLARVAKAEEWLSEQGFEGCRVRSHGDLARIEVPPDQIERLSERSMRTSAAEKLRSLGFRYVTIDMQGYRTGSLNESLDL